MSAVSPVILSVHGLSKRFGRKTVLEDLAFDVRRGEFFVIYGPSGAGKTILLKIIAGLLAPDRGEVILNGRPITDLPPEERGIAMTFQTYALYPHLTAFENIASPLRSPRFRQDPAAIAARVRAVADLLRIGHVLDHRPGELSGGEKQRVALARSIVRQAEILLLDDPLRNVDAKIQHEMRAELPHLVGSLDTTVLYVTQDYREALALGQWIGILRDGHFVQIGAPEEIYLRPVDAFVARSFGAPPINLIPAQVNAARQLDLGFWKIPVSLDLKLDPGMQVTVGLRPHDLFPTDPGADAFPGTVVAFEPLGTKAALVVAVAGDVRLAVSVPAEPPYRFGQVVHIHGNPGGALLFDSVTGARISPPATPAQSPEAARWPT
jgi:multiple sugar transport system ATP-binding protein